MDLQKLAGPGAGRVVRAFDLMRIAEEEIARAKLQSLVAFAVLCPPSDMHMESKADEVYRAHARELCARMKQDHPSRRFLESGTDAECLLALSAQSLKAPLSHGHALIMEHLFFRVFDELDVPAGFIEQQASARKLEKADQEILNGIRVEVRCPQRWAAWHGEWP